MITFLTIPRLNEDVELSQDNGYLFHCFSGSVSILENEVTIDIIKSIDGTNSVSNIVKTIVDKYPESNVKEVENDVIELLTILHKEGFVVY